VRRAEHSTVRGIKENVIVGRLIPAGTGLPSLCAVGVLSSARRGLYRPGKTD
jgi:hypothetical protein